MSQPCIHEQDWGDVRATIKSLSKDVQELDKDIHGNGKPGLHDTVLELSSNVRDLRKTTQDLATSVGALVKFQTETEVIRHHVERRTIWWFMAIGLLFTAINVFYSHYSSSPKQVRDDNVEAKGGAHIKGVNEPDPEIRLRDSRGTKIEGISPLYFPQDTTVQ